MLTPIPEDCLIMSWDLLVFFVVAKVACMNASANSFEERAIVDFTSYNSLNAGLTTSAVDC